MLINLNVYDIDDLKLQYDEKVNKSGLQLVRKIIYFYFRFIQVHFDKFNSWYQNYGLRFNPMLKYFIP